MNILIIDDEKTVLKTVDSQLKEMKLEMERMTKENTNGKNT